MKRGKWTRITAVLFAAALLAALCGCGDTPPEVSDPTTTASTTTTTTAEEITTTTTETMVDTTTASTATTTTLSMSTTPKRIVSPVFLGYIPKEPISGQSIDFTQIVDLDVDVVPEDWVEAGIIRSSEQLQTQVKGTENLQASLCQRYDDLFFQDQALIVVSYNQIAPFSSRVSDHGAVDGLIVNGDVLELLMLVRPNPSDSVKEWPEQIYQDTIVLEVLQSDIKNVRKIEALVQVAYLN